MQDRKLNLTEKMILVLTIVMLIIGYVLFFINISAFNHYVVEDGPVEWLTVFGLLLGVIVCISRFISLVHKRSWWFLTVTILIGLMLFFVAGEEISWGMRILGIHPSEFFEKNNAQHETNFHNLIVDGVKVNKLVFSLLLSIVFGIYLVIVPIVYQKNQAVKNFLDKSAVPVPRLYQIISFIALFAAVELMHHEKKAELLECGAGLLLFLIVRFPKNEFIFRDSKQIH
jgi:hypothetical protein